MNYRREMYWMIPLGIAIVALLIYGIYTNTHKPAPPIVMHAYSSQKYGVTFSYPDTYTLVQHDQGTHHSVVLIDKAAASSTPAAGEGPTAITLDIFPNTKKQSVQQWIKTNSNSNYKMSPDGSIASSTAAGREADAYFWDGLYHGESYVFAEKGNILMFTVTSLTASDKIRDDFASVLLSLHLE